MYSLNSEQIIILLSLSVLSKGGILKMLPGKVICGKNEITDWSVNNSTTLCKECPVCPTGYGSTFPCGGVKRYPHEKPIGCERCKNGKTFTGSWTTSDMCRPCSNCSVRNLKVLDKCVVFKDTVCGGCEDGYYEFRNESTGNNTCEKCSRCCDDRKDNKIQECIDQGLQSSGQVCSVFDKERCKPKPTSNHQESPTNMTQRSYRILITLPTIQSNENDQGTSDGLKFVFIAVAVVIIIFAIIGVAVAWCWCKKKNLNSSGSDIEKGDTGNSTELPLVRKSHHLQPATDTSNGHYHSRVP